VVKKLEIPEDEARELIEEAETEARELLDL